MRCFVRVGMTDSAAGALAECECRKFDIFRF